MNVLSKLFCYAVHLLKNPVFFWLSTTLGLLGYEFAILSDTQKDGYFFAAPYRVILAALLFLVLCVCAWHAVRQHKPLMPQGKAMWALFALACFCTFAANVDIYFPYSHVYVPLFVAIYSAMGTFCLLWGLTGRWSLIFWIPFLFLEIGQVAAFHLYGALVNHETFLSELFDASFSDVVALISPLYVSCAIICLALSCFIAYLLTSIVRKESRASLLSMGIIALILSGVFLYVPDTNREGAYVLYPEKELRMLVKNVRRALTGNEGMVNYVRQLPSPADKPSSISTLREAQGVVALLHIGESVRADRLSLNGYLNNGQSTTPWLDTQKDKSLINFTDCISSAVYTGPALITLLTDARRDFQFNNDPQYNAKAGSVLDLFDANHFSVYGVHGSVLMMTGKYDKVLRRLTKCAKDRFFATDMPQSVLPSLDNLLRTPDNLFLFINNEGSHLPFKTYDTTTAPFPVPPPTSLWNQQNREKEASNGYDNTIHYTDEFIRKLVEKLKGRPFIYIYVSDHGEYLGHNGQWSRATTGMEEEYHNTSACHVGMFIISSPEFEALHPHFAESVRNLRAHANMPVGHEHIYHTLLGIFGISTPYYNASLDLSNEAATPYTGPRPQD